MKSFRAEKALSKLLPFQRRTVEHAFDRLFVAPDSTSRFLVADEVGLGKTMVARGVIAKTIEHLAGRVGRIDIIYICSNASIARANLPKLRVGGEYDEVLQLSTRLTMLARQLPEVSNADDNSVCSTLNFVSLTPGTSFEVGSSGGRSDERVLLYDLLKDIVDQKKALMNVLQGGVAHTGKWRKRLQKELPLNKGIKKSFVKAFRANAHLVNELENLVTKDFRRVRNRGWPEESRRRRTRFIGEVRRLLARSCIEALEPDLVVLDEFQRFKTLLDGPSDGGGTGNSDGAAELARALFEAETPEGNPVRTLMLSATPYKLFTTDAEIDQDDHYQDFIGTTRFLLQNCPDRVHALQQCVRDFGTELKRAVTGQPNNIQRAKEAVQQQLTSVMARTERVSALGGQDSMLVERKPLLQLKPADVTQYLYADDLFNAVGDREPIALWKSAPYPISFMKAYQFNGELDKRVLAQCERLKQAVSRHRRSALQVDAFRDYAAIEPANPKMRDLFGRLLDGGLWRQLWLNPSVPYWAAEYPFNQTCEQTKALIFTAWNVSPDAISALLSYEAERRMTAGRVKQYSELSNINSGLRLHDDGSARHNHRLFALLLPCLPLADEANPLAAEFGADRREWVKSRIKSLLIDLPDPLAGPEDLRWEWAALLALDSGLGGFLRRWVADLTLPRPDKKAFEAYVDDIATVDFLSLGKRPADLVERLTDIALGSPAILAARTLSSNDIGDDARRKGAVVIADAFWRLFNRPAVVALLRSLHGGENTHESEDSYWHYVLKYCIAGNLQSVLDESWHLLWEQAERSPGETEDHITLNCIFDLADRIKPVRSSVRAKFLGLTTQMRLKEEALTVRNVFALRFAEGSAVEPSDDDQSHRRFTQDAVRKAFNSPFRPFVLASTSVGQEGLDFHPWCHQVVHWDLPGNPVDLEQREGRVHRYKGHALRRNVAHEFSEAALRKWRPTDDIWELIFSDATRKARQSGYSDLVPNWLAEGPYKVIRYVPLLPLSREVEVFNRLKRQLAAYRVVFGQPRQEEMLTLVDEAGIDERELEGWAIDLSPPAP